MLIIVISDCCVKYIDMPLLREWIHERVGEEYRGDPCAWKEQEKKIKDGYRVLFGGIIQPKGCS